MEDPREKVARFLAGWLAPAKRARVVGLNQVREAERSSPLSTRSVEPVAEERARRDAAEALAEEIVTEAETWAALIPRAKVVFTIAVFDSDDPNRAPVTQHPFIVYQEGDFAREEGDLSDPLTAAGMIARNAIDATRIASGNMQEIIEGLRAEIVHLRGYIAEQDRVRYASMLERERLLDGKAEREMRIKRDQFYLTAQEQGLNLLITYLTTKIMSGNDGPKVNLTAEQVVRFARCLNREQAELAKPLLDGLLALMTAEQKAQIVKMNQLAAAGKLPAEAMLNGAAVTAVEGRAS